MTRPVLRFVFLAITLLSCVTLMAQTNVPAVVSSNQTWTKAAGPYVISQNTVIGAGVLVKIEPGTVVRSTSPTNELTVDGTIEAVGKTGGMVTFDTVQIRFGGSAVPYDASTGKGNQFKWCRFNGPMHTSRTTTALSTGIRIAVDQCVFTGHRTALNVGTGGADSIWITNCHFNNNRIRSFGTQFKCYVTDNSFTNCDEMYFYGALLFERNHVDGLNRFSCYAYRNVDIHCNTFKHANGPLSMTFYGTGKIEHFGFTNNDLDSFSGSMITINRDNYIDKAKFNNNNFLYTDGNNKVTVSGTNTDQSASTRIDFTNNYWGTTSPGQIEDMVYDYGDNIQIYGKVDYSSFATSKIAKNCPTCEANFTITPDSTDRKKYHFDGSQVPPQGSAKWFIYNNSGNSYTELTGEDVSHRFSAGVASNKIVYLLYDSNGNLCDSTAQRIPCMASYYVGKDTNNKFKLFLINNSRGTDNNTTYLWSFGDGTTSTMKSPNHKYANFGKYEVCLSIANAFTGCESIFCDSIGLDSNGNLLKASGFELNVVDEVDLLYINEKPINEQDMVLYPNPSSGTVYVKIGKMTENETLVVKNSVGQVQLEVVIESELTRIDMSNNADGVYFLQVGNGKSVRTKRFILTK